MKSISRPQPAKPLISESEGEETHDDQGKPKNKKKHATAEYYDSELNIDNRTHFAPRDRVCVTAILKSEAVHPVVLRGFEFKQEDGTKEHPINLLGGEKVGKKRKNYNVIEENGKKRKVVDLRDFHPELQTAIEELKVAISKESWDVKGKFPPAIKPVLADVALRAVRLGDYDDFGKNITLLFSIPRIERMFKNNQEG